MFGKYEIPKFFKMVPSLMQAHVAAFSHTRS